MTDPLVAAAQFLQAQLDWLRHATDEMGRPYAASVFAEIRDCAARMRSVVEGPVDGGRFAGRCTALVDHPSMGRRVCGRDVIARGDSDTVTCKACGAKYDVGERQSSMRGAIEDWLARPTVIAGVLLRLGFPIGYSTIAGYVAKKQLIAHGNDDDGKPLYRIGDVIDLRLAAQERRVLARRSTQS